MSEENKSERLSRRERQIMEAAYRLGPATAVEIHGEIGDSPSLSTVRKLIRILEAKDYLRHRRDGKRHVYSPTVTQQLASRHAIKHLVRTFFAGSVSATVTALFDATKDELTDREARELTVLIQERAAKEERP